MAYTSANRVETSNRFEVPENYVGYWVFDLEGCRVGRIRMGLLRMKFALIPVQTLAVDRDQRILMLQ